MRIRLRGLNRVKKRLADGSVIDYWYAWKGGPRVHGEPGSPEFIASYNEAISRKVTPPTGVLLSITQGYQASAEFLDLANRTRADYIAKIKLIERKFGDFPLSAMRDRRTRGIFKAWRDELARTSRRQADYAWVVLALVIAWALDRGIVDANPCEKGGRLYRGTRVESIWTDDDEAAFLRTAPAHLRLAFMLVLWTGQRQGDLLRLSWSAYDGTHIRLKQSKSGRRVKIKVGAPLKAVLDATTRVSTIILTSTDNKPWTEDGFRSSWRKARAAAGITDLTFNDLRGTAVTRLATVESSVPAIATITGHSLRDAAAILDAHYLNRDPAMGDAAIARLESRTKPSNWPEVF
jgi:integrase